MSTPQILADLADSVQYLNTNVYSIEHAKNLCRAITNEAGRVQNIIRRVEEKELNQETNSFLVSLNDALSEEKKLFASIIKNQGSIDFFWWSRNREKFEKSLNKSFRDMKDFINKLNQTLELSDAKQPERNYFFPIKHEDATNEVEDPIGNEEEKSMPDQPDPPTRPLNNVETETLRKLCSEKPELQNVFASGDYAQALELALALKEFFDCYERLYLDIFRDWYLDAETLPSRMENCRATLAAAVKGLNDFKAQGLDKTYPENLEIKQKNIQAIEVKLAELEEIKADLPFFLEKRGTLDQFQEAMRLKRDGIVAKVSKMNLDIYQFNILNDSIPQLELCCVHKKNDDRDYLRIVRYDALKTTLERTVEQIILERRRVLSNRNSVDDLKSIVVDLKSTLGDLQSIRTELAKNNETLFTDSNNKMFVSLVQIAMERNRKESKENLDSTSGKFCEPPPPSTSHAAGAPSKPKKIRPT